MASDCAVRAAVWRNDTSVNIPMGIERAIIDSIGPETVWDEALQGMDTVIHLAARVHVMDENESDPLAAYRSVTVAGTQKLAHSGAAAGVKRLVFLSSVKVNGEETSASYTEDSPPAPQDPYGVSKLEEGAGAMCCHAGMTSSGARSHTKSFAFAINKNHVMSEVMGIDGKNFS